MSFFEFSFGSGTAGMNLFAQDTVYDISTSGSSFYVGIDGYNFSVSGSSQFQKIMNIWVEPLISSDITSIIDQRNTPFEKGFSVQDKTDPYTPRLVYRSAWFPPQGVAATFDHLYLFQAGNSNVLKVPTFEDLVPSGNIISVDIGDGGGISSGFGSIVLQDENTAYVTYWDDDTLKLRLSKVDFCDREEEIIYEWDWEKNNEAEYVSNSLFMVKNVYDGEEVLAIAENWDTDPTDGYKLHVIFYSITNDQITDLDLIRLHDTYDLNWFFNYYTPPAFYADKVVFTAGPTGFDGVDPSPLPTICVTPTFILDTTNKTVTKVDDITVDTSTAWPYILWGGAIDRDTKKHYFWMEDYKTGGTPNALGCVDLDAETGSVPVENLAYNVWILQGDTYAYGRKYVVPLFTEIVSIPNLTIISSGLDAGTDDSSAIVDEINSLVWMYNLDTNQLYGYSTDLGSRPDIIYTISGSGLFEYPDSRRVYLILLAGKFYIFVRSRSGVTYQYDWYLLNFDACI